MNKTQEMFGHWPKVNMFFKTADDQFFFTESDAHNHAVTLPNKEVIKEYRSDMAETETTEVEKETETTENSEVEKETEVPSKKSKK